MTSLQDKIAALKAGDYDVVLKGTKFDRDAIFTDSEGTKYTGCDNLVDIDYSLENAAKVIVLEEQVRVLREALYKVNTDVTNITNLTTDKVTHEYLLQYARISDEYACEALKTIDAALAATDMGY